MAEVEDDYDDESCSSSELVPHERLDRLEAMDKKPVPAGLPLGAMPVPPAATIIVPPRCKGAAMIRPEETASEGSRRVSSCTERPRKGDGEKEKGLVPPTVTTIDPADPAFHEPRALPKFEDPKMCMWTSSHAANAPSEDRSCSLVNVLMRPFPGDASGKEADNRTLLRLSLWSVIDGHGGGCVATYASEVLLPHVAASMARALKCEIVDRGVCTVNGELRDANALDLDGLIRTSDQSRSNANSIHYRAPTGETDVVPEDPLAVSEEDTVAHDPDADHSAPSMQAEASTASPLMRQSGPASSFLLSKRR